MILIENAPIEVRGDKETMIYAQDQNDQLDKATETANTRIPYASTFLQLDNEPIIVRGDKETMVYAQD